MQLTWMKKQKICIESYYSNGITELLSQRLNTRITDAWPLLEVYTVHISFQDAKTIRIRSKHCAVLSANFILKDAQKKKTSII